MSCVVPACKYLILENNSNLSQAADVSMNPDPKVRVPKAIEATLNILKAASTQPDIKAVVLTSSSTAAYTPRPDGEVRTITQGMSS